MRARTLTVLVFIGLLSVFVADDTFGCGQGYVYGKVTQKINAGHEVDNTILVNDHPYQVPFGFFEQVQVGDMVRFDGKQWTIVKPGQPSPNVPNLPPPAGAPTNPPASQP